MNGANSTVVNNETYNNNFILTESYIDSIATSYEPIGEYDEGYSKVRAWIRDRRDLGIEDSIHLNQTDENLIVAIKAMYIAEEV